MNAAMRLLSIDTLTLTISGQHADYSDSGSTFDPRYGLIWKLRRDLALRGSYGRSSTKRHLRIESSALILCPLTPRLARPGA